MKYFVFIFLLSFSIIRSLSQVIITPPPLAQGNNPTIIQLMYGIFNNTAPSGIDVYLRMVCTDNGKPIADIITKNFLLPSGITIINAQNAENLLYPVKVNHSDQKYIETGSRTSTLPAGIYQICNTVLTASADSAAGTNCYTLPVENFTSVNLLTPFNNGTIPNSLPIFNWTKVSGNASTFSNDVNYTLKIVKMNDNQSAVIAMQANPVIFKEEQIPFSLFQFPSTSKPLLPCIQYAWQIEAFQGIGIQKRSMIKSEIWSFRVNCEKNIIYNPPSDVPPTRLSDTIIVTPLGDPPPKNKLTKPGVSNHGFYNLLRTEYPLEIVETGDTLFFQFENNNTTGSNQLTYTILNLSNNKTSGIKNLDYALSQGIIRIALPLKNSGIAKGETGLFTLFDNSKYYYLSFKFKENKPIVIDKQSRP